MCTLKGSSEKQEQYKKAHCLEGYRNKNWYTSIYIVLQPLTGHLSVVKEFQAVYMKIWNLLKEILQL